MGTELAPAQNFEQRMRDGIRYSIGELLSDEELAKLVKRSMEELFFTERVTKDSYGRESSRKPPLLHDIVKELLAEKMSGEIRKWLQENEAAVWQSLSTTVTEGAGMAVVKAFNSIFSNALSQFQFSVQELIQRQNNR